MIYDLHDLHAMMIPCLHEKKLFTLKMNDPLRGLEHVFLFFLCLWESLDMF